MSKDIKFTKRPTTKLQEVVDSDLLTATERIVMGTLGGYYKMADEQAYFKIAGEKASMSVAEFEKKLKKLHSNFFVVYNPKKTLDTKVEGHSMGFYVPEYQGFVPLCKVGRSGERQIPANSQGKMMKQKVDQRGETEVAVVYRGYVAAFEAAKAFINDVQIDGIKPSRVINAKDFFTFKRVAEEIGGAAKLHDAFEQGNRQAQERHKAEQEELIAKELKEQEEATKNVEAFIGEVVAEIKQDEVKDGTL